MDKSKIIESLFSMQRTIVAELEEKVNMTHSMVDLDEDDTLDPEDFSHQYESGEMEALMKVQLGKAKRNLELLETIDFSPKDKVEQGAVLTTDKGTLVIGFAISPYDIDGHHIIGVSKDAPLYPFIMDKKEGESYKYGGVELTINKIQ